MSLNSPVALGDPTPTLDAELARRLQESRVPGMAAAVVFGDELIWGRAFGLADAGRREPMTLHASQAIASITKTVTATLLLHAAAAGRLDLDAPLECHLPFRPRNPAAPEVPITLRHILTHTSSLADGPDPGTYSQSFRLADPHDSLPDEWARMVFGDPESGFLHPWGPGERHAYANAPWALCAAVLRAATGIPMPEYFRRHVAEPLGLVNSSFLGSEVEPRSTQHALIERGRKVPATGFRLDAHLLEERPGAPWRADLASYSGYVPYGRYGYPAYPDGGLYSNACDLARYLAMWMNDGGSVLAAESVAEALRPQLPESMDIPTHALGAQGYRQCLTWTQDREATGLYWHEGGDYGTRTVAAFALEPRVGAVVLANASIPPLDPVDVLLRLLAEFGGPKLR